MTNELATTTTTLDPIRVGEIFAASGMFPDMKDAAQCATKLIVGRGMGLTDYDAMSGLHLIQGKVTLSANLMAAAIKRSGKYDYRSESNEQGCSIAFFARQSNTKHYEKIGTPSFTMEDAARAGLGGVNWKKYPRAMLFARCISAGYREHCPDALGNAPVYVEAHGEFEIQDPKPESMPKVEHQKNTASRADDALFEGSPVAKTMQAEPVMTEKQETWQDHVETPGGNLDEWLRRDAYDTNTYVRHVTVKEIPTGTLFIVTMDEPCGDEDGVVPGKRRTFELTTFNVNIGQAAIKFQQEVKCVSFMSKVDGKYTNLIEISAAPHEKSEPPKAEVHKPLTDDEIPF